MTRLTVKPRERLARRSNAERRDEAEQQLLKAALNRVAAHGLDRFSLADIGEAAGYSRGLPAHYFGTRSGLIVALTDHMLDRFGRALQAKSNHPYGLERLLRIASSYFDTVLKDPIGTRVLFVLLGEALNSPQISHRIAELNARSAAHYERNFTAAIAAGDIRAEVDPKAQSLLFLATLRGAVGLWLLSPESIDLVEMRDQFVDLLRRNLARAT